MDNKAAFQLGMTYTEEHEDVERVHVLTPELGFKLPRNVYSKKKLATHGVKAVDPASLTEAERQRGLGFCMEVRAWADLGWI